jgi:LPPG:FO 2-phospho-L-lactate transferase|tara:strand:- start:40 stop:1008 length:969 start_codon:yes stop_codon:yes gene_type:complete
MGWSPDKRCLAISGGIGGAKLALGLSLLLQPDQLAVVANSGDDFEHMGLHISPDLDTVMYTLADLSDKEQGWGLAGESWNFLDALQSLGGETWFRLGDRDMATHVTRTRLLAEGKTLSQVTAYLCQRLGVQHALFPMTDDPVATMVRLPSGELLSFQHYFVRDRCEPVVAGFHFEGIETAKPSPPLLDSLRDPNMAAIVICPSNPFVSIDPVLAVPTLRRELSESHAPVVAVSPIVGGEAIKGPTAKMMDELGMPRTALAVAEHYEDLLDGYVLDTADRQLAQQVEALGVAATVTNTVMLSLDDRRQLAEDTLNFVDQLQGR